MNFYNRFIELCVRFNQKPADVSRNTGIKKATISNWKCRDGNPTDANLQKLADYFGVSIEYLKGIEEIKKEPIQTKDRFSEMFYRLDNDDRQEIIDIMNMKLSKLKYKKENAG